MEKGSIRLVKNYYDMLKPKSVMRISQGVMGYILLLSGILEMSSLYVGIHVTGEDFQQGENMRILYIHVTSAWMSLGLYGLVVMFSVMYVINRHIFMYFMAKTNVYIGMNFSLITLMTGSVWGKPTWGSFWVWDARLTSVLMLFIIYVGYVLIDESQEMNMRAMHQSSIWAIIGFINIPIIKYSVTWWNTLHQSSSVTQSYVTLDQSIFIPLFLCFFGTLIFVMILFFLDMRKHILMRKMESYYL